MTAFEPATRLPPPLSAREEEVFPALTAAQLARLAAQGERRTVQAGDVLHDGSDHLARFFAVLQGRLEILSAADGVETIVTSPGAGQFTGELNDALGPPRFRAACARPRRARSSSSTASTCSRSSRPTPSSARS